jgi:transcriptional regulator with XRE-family HTH domain
MTSIKISKIRAILISKGITQARLAEEANLSPASICFAIKRIEAGDVDSHRSMRTNKLIALALGLDLDEITGYVDVSL